MAGIIVVCVGCGKDGDSASMKGLKCLDCRVRRATEPEKLKMSRLQFKANRYGDKGISLGSLRKQSMRLYRRAEIKALEESAGHPDALKILNDIFAVYFEKPQEPDIKIPETGEILKYMGKK